MSKNSLQRVRIIGKHCIDVIYSDEQSFHVLDSKNPLARILSDEWGTLLACPCQPLGSVQTQGKIEIWHRSVSSSGWVFDPDDGTT